MHAIDLQINIVLVSQTPFASAAMLVFPTLPEATDRRGRQTRRIAPSSDFSASLKSLVDFSGTATVNIGRNLTLPHFL
jgi:hypothetical protein